MPPIVLRTWENAKAPLRHSFYLPLSQQVCSEVNYLSHNKKVSIPVEIHGAWQMLSSPGLRAEVKHQQQFTSVSVPMCVVFLKHQSSMYCFAFPSCSTCPPLWGSLLIPSSFSCTASPSPDCILKQKLSTVSQYCRVSRSPLGIQMLTVFSPMVPTAF